MVITKRQLELEAVLAIILATFIGIFFAIYNNNNPQKFNIFSNIPIFQEDQEQIVTPIPPLPKPQTTSQISSDGTKKVIMKTVFNKDNTQTYSFSTADDSGNNEQTIFSKTLNSTKVMSIPFNTWSPDNKYFFIQEQTTGGIVSDVLVFKGSGEPIVNEEKYFDVTYLFKRKETGNSFAEATGWASETLIIVNTTAPDNTKGPSYWFELPSKAIIQLSTDF